MLLLSFLFNIALEILDNAIREVKERKGLQIGNEDIKLSLLVEVIIVYLEDTKGNTK